MFITIISFINKKSKYDIVTITKLTHFINIATSKVKNDIDIANLLFLHN